MEKINTDARLMLAKSGRYLLVDVSHVNAQPVREKSLRNCEGCEAAIALEAGAEQAQEESLRPTTTCKFKSPMQGPARF
jgi:hypothetical protein